MSHVTIEGRRISLDYPPYIIAELSANHNGSLNKALATISEARSRGADAVKLQTYSADTMTIDCDAEDFIIREGLWRGYKLYDLYREAQTPFSWHKVMIDHARKLGITCFSTPFDETAVNLLEDLNVPAYKLASFEATDLPLVRYIASTGKPMIMSTGMANLEEIEEMVATARDAGCKEMVVLHCISSYPAPTEQSNLLTIPDLRRRLGVEVGLSDHTTNNIASVVATSLGATLIEKHFILDRQDKGPDSSFSIMPSELENLCQDTNQAWSALGSPGYDRKPAEEDNVKFRRSVYFVKDLKAGDIITSDDIRRIRPGYGLPPKMECELIGKRVNTDIIRGTPTTKAVLDE